MDSAAPLCASPRAFMGAGNNNSGGGGQSLTNIGGSKTLLRRRGPICPANGGPRLGFVSLLAVASLLATVCLILLPPISVQLPALANGYPPAAKLAQRQPPPPPPPFGTHHKQRGASPTSNAQAYLSPLISGNIISNNRSSGSHKPPPALASAAAAAAQWNSGIIGAFGEQLSALGGALFGAGGRTGSGWGPFLFAEANADANRLYEDLMMTYNRIIRPIRNTSDRVVVKLSLKLSQLIEVVSKAPVRSLRGAAECGRAG